jgi:hypothetical protein
MELLNKLFKKSPVIKSKLLKEIYRNYENIDVRDKEDYYKLVNKINNDDLLKAYLETSSHPYILNTNFGLYIKYEQETHEFKIIDAICSGFPEYIQAEALDFNNENFKRDYESIYTPEEAKNKILTEIIKMDKVLRGKEEFPDSPHTPNSPFRDLYENLKKRRE